MHTGKTLSGIVLAGLLVSSQAHAARSDTQQALVEGGTLVSSVLVGTLAAGPVGFVLGALGGGFWAEQTRIANDSHHVIAQQTQQEAQLRMALTEQDDYIETLQQDTIQKLTFQILFSTGEDTLNNIDHLRIQKLAQYLKEHPDWVVSLAGHTDPRGTDEYNNVLAHERAKAVKLALQELGIDAHRVTTQGHGSRFTKSAKGDLKAYQHERRVDITLHHEMTEGSSWAKH